MIIVTHRNPILALVDRVFVMENGNIITDQTPEQLGIRKLVVMSDKEFKALARELADKQRHSSSILLLVIVALVCVAFMGGSY